MEKDKEYILNAITLSRKGNFPYAAIVVKDDRIIGEAYSGEGNANDPTDHAECLAIKRACAKVKASDLRDATIYCSCEPCFMCFGAIWWANVSRIVYGANLYDSNLVLGTNINISIEDINDKTGNKIQIMGGLQKDDAIKVMRGWQNKYDV